jgi:hypothetical protein
MNPLVKNPCEKEDFGVIPGELFNGIISMKRYALGDLQECVDTYYE